MEEADREDGNLGMRRTKSFESTNEGLFVSFELFLIKKFFFFF
jgi:hypothetical protein